MLDKLTSRKLIIAVGLTGLSTWLLQIGSIDAAVWSQFMSVNVIGYFAGNVGEHVAKK